MKNKKIAVFFDCENISAKYVEEIFDDLAKYGEAIIKQSFKDWENSNSKAWNKELHEEFAIEPIQVFSNKNYKNTADLRIQRAVFETMNQKNIDIIALVTSDSDFRDLVMSIKSNGFEAIGFGESKTPASLKNAYSDFIELPIKDKEQDILDKKVVDILKEAINNTNDDGEYSLVSKVGMYLKNKNSSYNPKNFGARTWGNIIKKFPDEFEICYLNKEKSMFAVKNKKS
ncbi:putative LabA/NYN domain protein [Campylobacter pinnipediorum subsp. pinnipediorum]|uniref:NYN domain-containing protein n=1 Tax=Campylobacter pinnipediorum TaxID=1965231 RepID=UPI0009952FE7|nr:NYN domain-containing protein [Campylobacter pinnipediorum]AQW85003.1 putative LabA/NYN domain protein [Campylobacter pinnipediorum subsp. pinnipediorum]OPA79854.1 nuclease [Campylobacter pinnipediorum subsp. pinnipediorum]